MTKLTPTPEQEAILLAATATESNLLLTALAGSAKTTTLVMIAEALPKVDMLCLAFNKRIALEMKDRLPPNCQAQTLNSLGHRAWADSIGRKLRLDTGKNYRLLTAAISKLGSAERKWAYVDFSDTLKAIAFGKACGYIPDAYTQRNKRLLDDNEFYRHLEIEPTDICWDLIQHVSAESIKEAKLGIIDFDDQILCPTVFSSLLPIFKLVMVDEAQDLSALNHALLSKLVRHRIIACGDACQAIYGFRGAHEDSMDLLKSQFSMVEYALTISFRCPKEVVRAAQWRAPQMRWSDTAEEGKVTYLDSWSIETLPQDCTIICRNNAPLFALAIKILAEGRYPRIVGADIGKTLMKWMKKLGESSMSQKETLLAITAWAEKRAKKSRDKGKVKDQAACMSIFAMQGRTLGDAIAYADHLLSSGGPIQLITGHKAKGLEYNDVFFLDQFLIRVDQDQERNLKYVIQTRAMRTLTMVLSEGFVMQKGKVDA